jgi:hypothetical protein
MLRQNRYSKSYASFCKVSTIKTLFPPGNGLNANVFLFTQLIVLNQSLPWYNLSGTIFGGPLIFLDHNA